MNPKRFVVVLIVVVVLAAGGCWAYQQYLAPESDPGRVESAAANTLVVNTGRGVVSAEGQIVPLRHAELAFQTGGQVVEILAQEWDTVTAGQPLLRLEAADQEAMLAQAEAALAGAEAALAAADTRVETAQVGVQAAQVGVTAAEAQLALASAEPISQEITFLQSNVAAAEAAIGQAAATRDAALVGATEAQIQSAQAQVAAAAAQERALQSQYDELIRHEILGATEEQARYALQAAEAALTAAETALAELNAGPTYAEQWAAGAAVPVTAAQRDAAQAQIDLLLVGPRPEQVALAEVGVQQAEAAVAQTRTAVNEAMVARAQVEAAVAQARAARDAAQAALEKTTLRAPFDGRIAHLAVELGQVVSPGLPVLTLADLSGWLVETTDLTEMDVVSVAVGLPVEVSIDAIPGETLTGRVTDVAAVSRLNRGDVTYVVTIALRERPHEGRGDEASDLPLRWGMTVFVSVEAEN